jgi:CBS domain containing-hemolysin-like protein
MEYLLLTIGALFSAVCEFLNAALFSMPSTVITSLADEGSSVGKRLRSALDEPEEARLSVSVVDAFFLVMTATSMTLIALAIGEADRVVFEIVALIIAVAILKSFAAFLGSRFADRSLRLTSILFTATLLLARPFVIVYRSFMRLAKPVNEEEEVREDLEALVETAREEGALDAGEDRILTSIMRFSSVEVGDVMTPRTVVFGVHFETPVADAIKMPELQIYSRFPVYADESLDDVSGYVMTKDVLRAALAGRTTIPLSKLQREVQFIPENVSLDKALEQFLQNKQHLFMVVDEYGGVEGLITMEDVIETMLGVEIVDEADSFEDLRALAKQRRDKRIEQMQATLSE